MKGAMSLIIDFNKWGRAEVQRVKTSKPDLETIYQILHYIGPLAKEHALVAGNAEWEGCHKLFRRHWFTRLWVIQEVGLSKSVTVFAGDSCLDFSELALFAVLVAVSQGHLASHSNLDVGHIATLVAYAWLAFAALGSWLDTQGPLADIRNHIISKLSASGLWFLAF